MTETRLGDEERPRVSFCLIVLNGEPFTRYWLRSVYPFAHEIIVVEGACRAAAACATPDGHSVDATLHVLRHFQEHEDPENKLRIVTRDGYWREKDDMCQAFAEKVTGDYLWQVDIDEFYKAGDIEAIYRLLKRDPGITAVSFRQIAFWGGFDYFTDGFFLRQGGRTFHRLFRWSPGATYVRHRPPTVTTAEGRDTRSIHWISDTDLASQGIYLYHYGLVFPQQVLFKTQYYLELTKSWSRPRDRAREWYQKAYLNLEQPFRVHNVYRQVSWLMKYEGTHPHQIDCLRRDLAASAIPAAMRPTHDIERLIRSPRYVASRFVLSTVARMRQTASRARRFIAGATRRPRPSNRSQSHAGAASEQK